MWNNPQDSSIIIHYFPQLLGVVYLFVFWPFLFQMKGLFGQLGILPISAYLKSMKGGYGTRIYYYIPTLFWFHSGDRSLMAVPIIGTCLSILLIIGIAPLVLLPLLFILHLSITSAGQEFLSFGWESLFLEISLYTFLLIVTPAPNLAIWWCLNFLLFRFHFEGGISKLLSYDVNWRNLKALDYHYFTQPIPNATAWYAHKLPMGVQKASCLIMLIIEIIVPFFLFGDETLRMFTFVCFAGLQYFIWLTGNFSYLNYLTLIFSTILIGNGFLKPLLGPAQAFGSNPLVVEILMSFIGAACLAGQLLRVYSHFSPHIPFTKWFRYTSPFHIINRYGIFAVMTTKRYEIIIEGSNDGENWKEYSFKWKPSEVDRRPRRVSPYQPRLDWQAWFLPFTVFAAEPWIKNFLYRLLGGSPDVLKLLKGNPFKDAPPKYVRAVMYDYTYTSLKEKKETGNWWNREYVGHYSPTYELTP